MGSGIVGRVVIRSPYYMFKPRPTNIQCFPLWYTIIFCECLTSGGGGVLMLGGGDGRAGSCGELPGDYTGLQREYTGILRGNSHQIGSWFLVHALRTHMTQLVHFIRNLHIMVLHYRGS